MTQFPNAGGDDPGTNPGGGGGGQPPGGGIGDCSSEFNVEDEFLDSYDPTDFTIWNWTSPQRDGFSTIVNTPVNIPSDGTASVRKMYSIDTRGRLAHPGRTNGPSGNTGILDTQVNINSIEDYAVSAARGLIAQIVADGLPDKIAITFYTLGSSIKKSVKFIDDNGFVDVDDILTQSSNQINPQYYYSQEKQNSDDFPDGAQSDFHTNTYSPALFFNERDALPPFMDFSEYGGPNSFQIYQPINTENISLGNTSQVTINGEQVQANKVHATPHIAWTPWMSNGIQETKTFIESFIQEYKRIQIILGVEQGLIVKDPVRLYLDSEIKPSMYNAQTLKVFALCQNDPRYDTEILPGWGVTLKQLVDSTPNQTLNLDQDATDADGREQRLSLSSWEWKASSNGHGGILYAYTNSIDGPLNYQLPCRFSGDWLQVGSGKWYGSLARYVPEFGGAGQKRYDFCTFANWYDQVLEVVCDAALEEAVYAPMKEAFPGIECSNYGTYSSVSPIPINANDDLAFTGQRTDVNDDGVFNRVKFGGEIISPVFYNVSSQVDIQGDPYTKRKEYYKTFIDTLLDANPARRTLLGSNLSPYDGNGTFSTWVPDITNLRPWIQIPTSSTSVLLDTEETVCSFISMLREKGILEVLGWNIEGVGELDTSTEETNLPTFVGGRSDIFDAVNRSSVSDPDDPLCCRCVQESEPVPHEVDRRPIYIGVFAAGRNEDQWGVPNSTAGRNYSKTPAIGESMTNPNTNGRLRFMNERILPAVQNGFERISLTNIGGFTNFGDGVEGKAGYFPSNAWASLVLDSTPNYALPPYNGNIDGTVLSEVLEQAEFLPSPFTATGIPGGPIGDQGSAWKTAIDAIKAINPDAEITAYVGWRPHYQDSTLTSYDRISMALDPTSERSPQVSFFDFGWWRPEYEGFKSIGFNGIGFDTGGNVWRDSGNNDTIINQASSMGMQTIYEAVPLVKRTSDGKYFPHGVLDTNNNPTGQPDERYEKAAYWAYYPGFFGSDRFPTSGIRRIDNIVWDPDIHEVHAVFDYYQCIIDYLSNGPLMTIEEMKEEMVRAYLNGFIVSLSSGVGLPDTPGHQEIRQFVIDLYRGLVTQCGTIPTEKNTETNVAGQTTFTLGTDNPNYNKNKWYKKSIPPTDWI